MYSAARAAVAVTVGVAGGAALLTIFSKGVRRGSLSAQAERVRRMFRRAPRRFPEGFMWGTATAAYQVEGAVAEGGRSPSTWDTFCATPGNVANGESGDEACLFYYKYKEDVALAKRAGGLCPTFRFSVSWSRVVPTRGQINQEGLSFYIGLVEELLRSGVVPLVTLFHWDTPQWCEDYGGWQSRSIVEDFADYAEAVFSALGDRVPFWITINEPWVTATLGYGSGVFAPGKQDTDGRGSYLAAHHQLLAHSAACKAFRTRRQAAEKQGGSAQIGIALNCMFHSPADPSSADDCEAAERGNVFELGWFGDPLYFGDYPDEMRKRAGSRLPYFTERDAKLLEFGRPDFFGLNHYSTQLFRPAAGYPENLKPDEAPSYEADIGIEGSKIENAPKAAPDWLQLVPWGLRNLLVWIHDRYGDPKILITENGCACPGEDAWAKDRFSEDRFRQGQIKTYINGVWEAMNDYGVDVIGYTYWSLMDNFEWADGYAYRFGLVHVDFASASKARAEKKSFYTYREITSSNSVLPQPQRGPVPYWRQ